MKTIPTILLLCLALFLQPAWSEDTDSSEETPSTSASKPLLPTGLKDGSIATLYIANHRIRVEIASTPQSREYGLMQRDQLCDDCGMLFVFEKADKYSFWMKDTLIPLSIAFIAADGNIINIDEMLPNTTDSHNPKSNALYALEMNKGWFAREGITSNIQVQGLKLAPKVH